jgi:nucleotide-binding universal stress UspA family protein
MDVEATNWSHMNQGSEHKRVTGPHSEGAEGSPGRTIYPHIAVCLDNSEASLAALDEASRLRRSLGAGQLSLVYVIDAPRSFGYGVMWLPDSSQLNVDQHVWLAEIAAAHPGSSVVVLDGYPAAKVCEWAAQANVDLLVAAASRGLFERVLLGSFSGYLAHHSPCPVVLTRPPAFVGEPDATTVQAVVTTGS